MNLDDALAFVRAQRLAVVSTVAADAAPQAALMGIAPAPDGRLIFDTSTRSRKYANLLACPRVAIVVGWSGEVTVQIEGRAEMPSGEDLQRCQQAYFAAFPDGRSRLAWPDIAYVAVRVTWLRYADYGEGGATITEFAV